VKESDYEEAVVNFYEGLYAFGYSLTRKEDDAFELTQEAFYRLLTRGAMVRDASKIKSWLFTTLYRIFLGWERRRASLPHFEISTVENELASVTPEQMDVLLDDAVRDSLLELEGRYRAPLMLFYLNDHSYEEIARILAVPIGTVMSRLSRGKALLRQRLGARAIGTEANSKVTHLQRQLDSASRAL
jgi:RNA polymerase sigma-70 factor (ECF subfamily)